ncbi:MAG TPA: hypothetical protein V6C85_27985 [Allocoleopsis sp.]
MSFTKINAASYLFMGMDASGSGNSRFPESCWRYEPSDRKYYPRL